RVSIDTHPLTLLRPHLPPGVLPSDELNEAPHRSRVAFAGMAVARQRPPTPSGIAFMLLEDELGQANPAGPGRFGGIKENRNMLADPLESLGPLARRLASSDVGASLPSAHPFGHR